MIETILTLFVIPLASKLGDVALERIIKTLADGFDAKFEALLKKAMGSPDAERELMAYVKQHPEVAARLKTNADRALRSSDLPQTLDLPRLAARGARLPYYVLVLRGLAEMAVRRQSDVVVSGALNTPLGITYVSRYQTMLTPPESSDVLILEAVMDIRVAFHPTAEARDAHLATLRKAARRGESGRIPESLLESFYAVVRVHDHWLDLSGWKSEDLAGLDATTRHVLASGRIDSLAALPEAMQDKIAIDGPEGIAEMLRSAGAFVSAEADDLAKLGQIVLG